MGEPGSADEKPSVGAYWSLVKKNKLWRTLWIGEVSSCSSKTKKLAAHAAKVM